MVSIRELSGFEFGVQLYQEIRLYLDQFRMDFLKLWTLEEWKGLIK